MLRTHSPFAGLSLFTCRGERKYLNTAERSRFLASLTMLDDPTDQTFCEMLLWSGCRPSEALNLRIGHIDLDGGMVIIRSLKKRKSKKGRHYRAVPLPPAYLARLDEVHMIRTIQARPCGGMTIPLWPMGRTTAWERVRSVMDAAHISGARACARGLRHAFGVHAALKLVPETRIQKWMGHESLETTAIYLDVAGAEDRAMAERMWAA